MNYLEILQSAISMLLTWEVLGFVIIGMFIGVWVGAIPGISAVTAISVLLIPSTYLDPFTAIAFLTAIYCGTLMGGSISAVLLNVPGTPGAVATCFDGFPLTKQGRFNEALGISLLSSVCGCFISWLLVLFLFIPITSIVLKFGPAEMLMVVVFALTMMGMAGAGMIKTLIGACFGMMLSAIGASTLGYARANLGIPALIEGIDTVPFIIGMFAVSELFFILEKEYIVSSGKVEKHGLKQTAREIMTGFKTTFKHKITIIRSAVVGMVIGLLPAAGSSVSSVVCYGIAKNNSKNKDNFGKGEPDGIVAAETGNNAAEGGAIATLMAFGIPGSGAAALLMSCFIMHGMTPGPSLLRNSPAFSYAVILVNIGAAFILLLAGFIFALFFSRVVNVPSRILVPAVMIFTFFGATSMRGFVLDGILLVVFGLIGYFYRKGGYPTLSLVLGFILGDMLEGEIIRTILLYSNDYFSIFNSLIVRILIACTVLMCFWPKFKRTYIERKTKKQIA